MVGGRLRKANGPVARADKSLSLHNICGSLVQNCWAWLMDACRMQNVIGRATGAFYRWPNSFRSAVAVGTSMLRGLQARTH